MKRGRSGFVGVFLALAALAGLYLLTQRPPAPTAPALPDQATAPSQAAPGAPPRPPLRAGDTLRIGSWNIEWLGTPDRRSGPARNVAQKVEDLADYIAAANVDVLGVIEIARDDARDAWTSPILDAAFAQVDARRGSRWAHQLHPARSGRNQLVGLAWDAARVTPVGPPRVVVEPSGDAGDEGPLWARPPRMQAFSPGAGLAEFDVVVVHMKSNFGGDFSAQRAREAQAFVAALPRAAPRRDLVLIGDFNCGAHTEPAIAAFEAAGFVDLNPADAATHARFGPLDRALVPAAAPGLAGRRFEVRRDNYLNARNLSEEQFRVRFSDHFMVVTELTVRSAD